MLRLAADGRREYAVNAPQVQADVLETQACVFESAARIAEGDYRSLKGYLPSWRWGDIPTAVSRASGYTLDDQGRRVADGWDHDGDLVATMQGDMNRLAAERDAARSEAVALRAAGDELAQAAAAHVAYTSTDSGRERLREELLGHVRAWDVAWRSAAGSPTTTGPAPVLPEERPAETADELPATLRTVEDVAAVCETAGLSELRRVGSVQRWGDGQRVEVGVNHFPDAPEPLAYIHGLVPEGKQWSVGVGTDTPVSACLAAIRAAQGGTR